MNEVEKKEIEEMSKIMCVNCVENETLTCSYKKNEVPCCFANCFAKSLYDAGYRKVFDENNRIVCKNLYSFEALVKQQAIKEFVEKLTQTLIINNEGNTKIFDYDYTLQTIKELAKEYAVDIDEVEEC